jgi:hypothetical protein
MDISDQVVIHPIPPSLFVFLQKLFVKLKTKFG